MDQNYDGIAINQLRNTQLEKKLTKKIQKIFNKGFMSLVALVPIIPQHRLDQTKEHVLRQYITTCQK